VTFFWQQRRLEVYEKAGQARPLLRDSWVKGVSSCRSAGV